MNFLVGSVFFRLLGRSALTMCIFVTSLVHWTIDEICLNTICEYVVMELWKH